MNAGDTKHTYPGITLGDGDVYLTPVVAKDKTYTGVIFKKFPKDNLPPVNEADCTNADFIITSTSVGSWDAIIHQMQTARGLLVILHNDENSLDIEEIED